MKIGAGIGYILDHYFSSEEDKQIEQKEQDTLETTEESAQ
jgi:hypothetical protein